MTGVYIHFPFCTSKCPYCEFFSIALNKSCKDRLIGRFIDGLREEFFRINDIFCGGEDFENLNWTIYLGGGTPSLGGRLLAEKVSVYQIQKVFKFKSPPVEATFEVNPESRESMLFFKESGYQRVSVGVQSLKDDLLRVLGRVHNSKDAIEAVELALKNFTRVNVDLIYGIPGQTPEDFYEDIERLVDAGINHISLYPLTVGSENRAFRYELPPKDLLQEMYITSHEILVSRGFVHYEISNFSRGIENVSLHNLNYWIGGDYFGFGPSAHSRYRLMRWENSRPLSSSGEGSLRWRLSRIYCDCNDASREKLDLFLLMRIREWIPSSCFDADLVKELADMGLIEFRKDMFRLTPLGWFSYNRVFDLLTDFKK